MMFQSQKTFSTQFPEVVLDWYDDMIAHESFFFTSSFHEIFLINIIEAWETYCEAGVWK